MTVLNNSLAGALGRPDLVFRVQQSGTVYGGAPPTVIAGSSATLTGQGDNPGGSFGGGGRGALVTLMVLLGGYAAFTWWVRPHLA